MAVDLPAKDVRAGPARYLVKLFFADRMRAERATVLLAQVRGASEAKLTGPRPGSPGWTRRPPRCQ